MQGKKYYEEKFFTHFRLSERVPDSNFYKRLKESLDLEYLRPLTKSYYGSEGQKSIDPVVFFKLMLIGYLENITSDRKIIEQSSLRLDVLYFLDYDIDEPLPWHGTLSRTRRLFGEEVFLEFFRDILRKCVAKGMVNGKIQAVDSAFIKANASISSVVEKELEYKSKQYFADILENEESSSFKSSNDKNDNSDGNSKSCNKRSNYNARHISLTDPDARLSRKPGKPYALNHLGIISVDTSSHVICGATVDYADKRDSETVENIVGQTIANLSRNDITVEEVLADAGYSSGEAYKFFKDNRIKSYIPPCGNYKSQREGFSYDKENDCYICRHGAKLTFRGIIRRNGRDTSVKVYGTRACNCRICPFREQCCKNMSSKRIYDSLDKPYYDEAYERLRSSEGRHKMGLRSSVVEPVLGTLLNFRRMKKVYTIGQKSARKQFLMAAAAYNLKKLMNAMSFKCMKVAANMLKTALLEKIWIWNKFILLSNKVPVI